MYDYVYFAVAHKLAVEREHAFTSLGAEVEPAGTTKALRIPFVPRAESRIAST